MVAQARQTQPPEMAKNALPGNRRAEPVSTEACWPCMCAETTFLFLVFIGLAKWGCGYIIRDACIAQGSFVA